MQNSTDNRARSVRVLLWTTLAVFVSAWTINAVLRHTGYQNLYVHQANAFIKGHLDISATVIETIPPDPDIAVYNGAHYVIFPPFPALLVLPFVAIFGMEATKTALFALALTFFNVVILRNIFRNLGVDRSASAWLTAGLLLGTAYLFAMTHSWGVWFFAHVVAMTCMLLAINEALGKGRGVVTGLFLGMAFLSRQLSIYATVFLCAALWSARQDGEDTRPRYTRVLSFLCVVGISVAIYLAFNLARFGNMFDTGYSYLPLRHLLDERVKSFGLFSPAYIPFNLTYMFLQGFHVEFAPPKYLVPQGMDLFGTAITFASPFVFAAFAARWKKGLLPAAWISIGLTLAHMLLYYNNGFKQVNAQRFTLDFLPILMVLVALGTKRIKSIVWKGAIAYSVLFNILALILFQFPKLLRLLP